MTTIHLDFESRSTVDLKNCGVDVYARHPTTALWCAAYAVDDGPVQVWLPGQPVPAPIANLTPDTLIYAHNAAFEFRMWQFICAERHGWPAPPLARFRCTMAMAYAMSLPGSLEGAASAVGLEIGKDAKGHRLMLQMARPRKVTADKTIWWDSPDKLARLIEYCKRDVDVERALQKRLLELTPREQKIWQLDQRINMTGVPVDTPSVKAGIGMIEREQERLDASMARATGGMVKCCTWVSPLRDWLASQGVHVVGVAKDVVRDLLADPELPAHVRRVLELRQQAGKSSTAKLRAFTDCMGPDARVRYLFQYHGAGPGRWAGRKVQLQNLPRGNLKPEEIESALALVRAGGLDALRMVYGPPLDVISSGIRGLIQAPEGYEFTAADFSNIEGRKLAWLAGEKWKLQVFRDFDAGRGHDPYKVSYGRIAGMAPEDVTKELRLIGKVLELAMGYEGGVGAFETMAAVYGLDMAEHFDEIKAVAGPAVFDRAMDAWHQRGKDSGVAKRRWLASEMAKILWRNAHPATVQFWKELQAAAIAAVASPGEITQAGRHIRFRMSGSFLFASLPCGRTICYPYPRIREEATPWGSTQAKLYYKGVNAVTRKWEWEHTYGGKLAENVTQGAARDILADAMVRLDEQGANIVLHVHDEVVVEHEVGRVKWPRFKREMERVPEWARGLPIAVDGWQGRRYRKD